ncbi:hypothetical protein CBM2633_B90061 [Cupriavidus taiwanensis]|nr:hypothetical protein CBM2604_B60316 [Cupriavidus taiwanensis]SOZ33382.1 hypothetical protein CBM2609_B70318 [Cupriavidus taiwanensis]SOZ48695.1 hypothetical protein CBM2610_B50318 [Cupriavidus taiwanensis]SPA22770.1 hypothetical protein CBM2633_B90061 [Cupriavidus taiwanensis]
MRAGWARCRPEISQASGAAGNPTDGPGAQRPGQPPRVPRAGVNHKIQDLVMRGDFILQTDDRPVCDYSNPGTVHWRSLALSHPRQSP